MAKRCSRPPARSPSKGTPTAGLSFSSSPKISLNCKSSSSQFAAPMLGESGGRRVAGLDGDLSGSGGGGESSYQPLGSRMRDERQAGQEPPWLAPRINSAALSASRRPLFPYWRKEGRGNFSQTNFSLSSNYPPPTYLLPPDWLARAPKPCPHVSREAPPTTTLRVHTLKSGGWGGNCSLPWLVSPLEERGDVFHPRILPDGPVYLEPIGR